MTLQPAVVLGGGARGIDLGVGHAFPGQCQHTVAGRRGQKLALGIQEFEGIPLFGVV